MLAFFPVLPRATGFVNRPAGCLPADRRQRVWMLANRSRNWGLGLSFSNLARTLKARNQGWRSGLTTAKCLPSLGSFRDACLRHGIGDRGKFFLDLLVGNRVVGFDAKDVKDVGIR